MYIIYPTFTMYFECFIAYFLNILLITNLFCMLLQANIIAQTRIQFNDRQLFQLIQQHLLNHGMYETASVLQKEAGLPVLRPPTTTGIPSPFSYQQRLPSSPTCRVCHIV